jgi:hypothetical protein
MAKPHSGSATKSLPSDCLAYVDAQKVYFDLLKQVTATGS